MIHLYKRATSGYTILSVKNTDLIPLVRIQHGTGERDSYQSEGYCFGFLSFFYYFVSHFYPFLLFFSHKLGIPFKLDRSRGTAFRTCSIYLYIFWVLGFYMGTGFILLQYGLQSRHRNLTLRFISSTLSFFLSIFLFSSILFSHRILDLLLIFIYNPCSYFSIFGLALLCLVPGESRARMIRQIRYWNLACTYSFLRHHMLVLVFLQVQ